MIIIISFPISFCNVLINKQFHAKILLCLESQLVNRMQFVFEKTFLRHYFNSSKVRVVCYWLPDCVFFLLLIFSREIEGSIEHMSNLRRDKWVVEGKIRKWVCTYWPFLWPFDRMAPLSKLWCSISLSSAPTTKSKCVNDVTDTRS